MITIEIVGMEFRGKNKHQIVERVYAYACTLARVPGRLHEALLLADWYQNETHLDITPELKAIAADPTNGGELKGLRKDR